MFLWSLSTFRSSSPVLQRYGAAIAVPVLATTIALTAATPAMAADFAGDCCADLEERVALLDAETANKGNRKVSLSITGFVNQALMAWDDGVERNVYVVNNDNRNSRIGFRGEAAISSDWRAGYFLEINLTSAGTNAVSQRNDDSGDIGLRQSYWYVASKTFGGISVGQLSPASDNVVLAATGDTDPAALTNLLQLGGAFAFRRSDTGAFAPVTVRDYTAGIDTRRLNAIKYQSPTVNGFFVATSFGEDDFWDVGLWYADTVGDFLVKARAGYLEDTDATNGTGNGQDFTEVKGSVSVRHLPTGVFLTLSGNQRMFDSVVPGEADRPDFTHSYVRAGILQRVFAFGNTSIYGEYAVSDGLLDQRSFATGGTPISDVTDSELTTFGFGVVQHIDAAAAQVYATYRNYDPTLRADGGATALALEDIDIVTTGVRIRF